MNTNEPPQSGPGGAPPAPVAMQQTTVVHVGTQKSVVGAVLLAFFFGPLGMLYATVPGAIVMFFVNLIVGVPTLGLGLFVTIPVGALWAGLAANSQNKRLQAVSAQQVATGQAAPAATPQAAPPVVPPVAPPAGPPAAPPQPLPPPAREPAAVTDVIEEDEEEVDVVLKSTDPAKASCKSCGHEIDPRARFCSACGTAQAPA
jgi:hypothetical protein